MIIVSQDREIIINYNKLDYITIGKNDKEEYAVMIHAISNEEFPIGIYETKERAKEILQEIIIAINGKSQIEMTVEGITTTVSGAFYEMPLE